MKRWIAIWFSFLLLLSSGFLQFVVHVCPEDGASISAANCESHHPSAAPCCEELEAVNNIEDCCSDAFVFGITAKFQQQDKTELPLFAAFSACLPLTDGLIAQSLDSGVTKLLITDSGPPLSGRDILTQIRRLSI